MSNYTKKNDDGSYTTTHEFTPIHLSRLLTIAFLLVILSIIAIVVWRNDHPKGSEYRNAGWSSLVVDLPPRTKDWKEWKGKTYCLLDDNEWHECEPKIVNAIPKEDR